MIALRLIALEARRLFAHTRWLAAGAVTLLAAWLSQSSVSIAAFNSGRSGGAADVYLALINNVTVVGYLLLPAFALVATGSLAADRASGFSTLVLARAGSRAPWWAAKVVVVLIGAIAFQIMMLACSWAAASFAGLAVTRSPSALALVPNSESAMVLFAPALEGDDMALRVLVAAAFLVLVFSALGIASMTASVVWGREYLPAAVLLGAIFIDWLLVRYAHLPLYERLGPSVHLLESSHFATLPEPIAWTASTIYFAVMLIIGCIAGGMLVARRDL